MAVSDKPSPVAATGLTGVAALRPLTAAHNVHVVIRLGSTSFSKTTMEKQELSYRKQIARQLRTQFVEGISVTLKSTLRVTQGHWKRNHWTDHTRLTVRRVIGRWILPWPWNVGQRSLKVIESLKVWVRFPNFSYPNHNPNPNPRVRGQGHWKWRRSIDHMRLSIGPPL